MLDLDKDGYVSGKDLNEYLVQKNLLSQKEADGFCQNLGIKYNQPLSHRELHQKIYENFCNSNLQSEKENQSNVMGLKFPNANNFLDSQEKVKKFFQQMK